MKGRLALLGSVAFLSAGISHADPTPEALLDAGHFKRARALVEPMAAGSASDPRAAYLLSRVKLAFGDREGALLLAEKAVSLDAGRADYHFQLAQVVGEMAEHASFFRQLSLAHRFRDEAEKACALDPSNLDALEGLMTYNLEAPGIAGGDKSKALDLAAQISRIDPLRGLFAKAEIARQEHKPAEREAAFQSAVELRPRDPEARTLLADFYASDAQKKYDLAEAQAREAISADPSQSGGYRILAEVYAHGRRYPELDAILAQGEKNSPDNLNSYYQAGRILLLEGSDLSRAEAYLRKYLSQEPEAGTPPLSAAHWRLGLVLEKEGKRPEAVLEVETAVKLQPDIGEAKKDLNRLRSR